MEEEQRGRDRADYGAALLRELSQRLTEDFGKGFTERNLWFIRQFYLTYPRRQHGIRYTARTESDGRPADTPGTDEVPFRPDLSWSHYRVLMRVDRPEAPAFYEAECAKARSLLHSQQPEIPGDQLGSYSEVIGFRVDPRVG